jgi:hypothetical protein
MATVTLTNSLKEEMCINLGSTFQAERDALPKLNIDWPMGTGDELYSCLLPLDKEESIRSQLPLWAQNTITKLDGYDLVNGKYAQAKLSTSRLFLPRSPALKPPGFSQFVYDGYTLNFKVEDVEKLELPLLKKAMQDHAAVQKQYQEFDANVEAEKEKLRKFLDNFRTLQQAVAKFGPALLAYVPSYQKKLYEKPVVPRPPRQKRGKKELVEVEIDSLVARAMAETLGMNGDKKEEDAVKSAPMYAPSSQRRAMRMAQRAASRPVLNPMIGHGLANTTSGNGAVTANSQPHKFTI